MDPRPLGEVSEKAALPWALACGAAAAVVAALLLELSRTLAERARGRWYAGNGRDLFHFGAAGVIFAGLFVAGEPPPLCAVGAAFICAAPLLALDALPARRNLRLLLLLSLFFIGQLPALLAPRAVAEGANQLARLAFPSGRN